MLKINQLLRAKIHKVDEEGFASLKFGRDIVRVKHVIMNEEVEIKVVKKLKDGYVGEVVKILKPSENRVRPKCSIYDKCGSCHLLHMKYDEQLKEKKNNLIELVKHAKLPMHIQDVIGMDHPYAYRNKIIIGFNWDKNRKIQAGFYEEFSHRIIPYKACLLHDEKSDAIIQSIVNIMSKLKIEPYDEHKRRGILRHVLIRKGSTTNEYMVVVIVNQQIFPARKNFVSAILKEHPYITTIVQNINSRKTSVVLGDTERVLYGPGFIEDELCELRFRISPKSFYQINHDQCVVLYKKAIDLLTLNGNETLLDTYCGIGTIGMYASKFVKQVIGVEVNKAAIKDAIENAKHNHIKNIRFVCDDASAFMQSLASKKEKVDIVIMDPPRDGSNKTFMDAISIMKPKQILYISCNPITQIEDLKYFKKLGYLGESMIPVDLFPNTKHVESIVKLVKIK